MASDAAGNFVVVWTSHDQDGSYTGVYGQRYASTGAPLGPEFRVNTYTTRRQDAPAVASDSSGNFVVVWRSGDQDGSSYGIFAQRYASTGAPLGPEFRVNTYTTSDQRSPRWPRTPPATSSSSGGATRRTAQATASSASATPAPARPSVPSSASTHIRRVARLIRSWPRTPPATSSSSGIAATRTARAAASSASATPAPARPSVPSSASTRIRRVARVLRAVASDSSGNFVVVWQSYAQDGDAYGVFGQRYRAIVPVELMRFEVE